MDPDTPHIVNVWYLYDLADVSQILTLLDWTASGQEEEWLRGAVQGLGML